MDDGPLGMIAGWGRLPSLVAEGARRAGRNVAAVGLRHSFEADLPDRCDRFGTAGVFQVGRQIRLLRRFGCREAVLVGKLEKTELMYHPWRLLQNIPDLTTFRLWWTRLRHDMRTDAMLGALCDTFAKAGITMIDTTQYIPEQLADEGVMTRTRPSNAQQRDIEFALPIVREVGRMDIGQAITVKELEVIAVEAIEGTDRMMQRTGELCRVGDWTLVKLAKPEQDKRFDVPVVGVDTIRNLKQHGGSCLAVEAGKLIMIDKPEVIAEADRLGVSIVGVNL